MAKWNHKSVYSKDDLQITKSTTSNKGDIFNPPTMSNVAGGVHWITQGSTKLLNVEAVLTGSFTRGQQVGFVDPLDYQAQQAILIADGALEFYCIVDPALQTQWGGTIYDLTADEQRSLTGVQGRKLFIAEGSLIINGVEQPQHAVIHIDTVSSVSVTAGTNGAMFAEFGQVQ